MNLLNLILKDDNTGNGGISHALYTLEEFLFDTELNEKINFINCLTHKEIEMINAELIENGIFPINKENYNLEGLI